MPAFFSAVADSAHIRLLSRLRHLRRQPPAERVRPWAPPSLLDSFEWPSENTFQALGGAIAKARGLRIVVKPIPEGMGHAEVSGLTTVIGRTAHVFYDADLSPINQEQTVLHEYAHILHGDVRAGSECTHMRSMFEDPVEKRAETTGMRLLAALHSKRQAAERTAASEVLAFLSGTDDSAGRA